MFYQLRTLDFVRTKIAVYPHTFADVLTETRYGDVILLEDDIYSPDGYKAFLNKTISIVEKYVGVVASDFESIVQRIITNRNIRKNQNDC